MNFEKIRTILAIGLIVLFPLLMCQYPLTNGLISNPFNDGFSITGTDVFTEDFTSTTYRDNPTTAFGWGTGAVTNQRNFSWNLLDYYHISSPVVDVEVQGRKAYTALYNSTSGSIQISILNINDPTNIVQLGSSTAWLNALTLAVDGDELYSGQNTVVGDSIVVNDVTDPFNPAWKYAFSIGNGIVTDIDPDGHLVYFATYGCSANRSLKILYAEDPTNPKLISTDWNTNQTLGVKVEGHLAYIAASTEGFYVLNVSDKYSPVEYGYVDTPGNATDVIIDGQFVYLADGLAGVHIIDVMDPTNPTIIGSYNTPGYAHRLAKQGNTLFVADGDGGVQVLDVSNPHRPILVTEMRLLPYTWDLDLYGGDLIVATDSGIYSYRIGHIISFSDSWYENPFSDYQVWDVRVKGDIAYVAGGPDGFYTLNVHDPLNPVLLDRYIPPVVVHFRKLDINGQYAHVTTDTTNYIFDISDPTDIKFIDSLSGATNMIDIFAQGPILFVSLGTIVGIANATYPSNLGFITSFPVTGSTNITGLWAQGRLLYVTENVGGWGTNVFIYDITDLTTPVLLDTHTLNSYGYDIHVDGDIAYVGDTHWLIIYNVTDPTNILPDHSSCPGGNFINSYGTWAFGPHVLNAAGSEGVYLVNEMDFATQTATNYPNATGAIQITSHGDYTYVANETSLVILRHFESAGATFIPGSVTAQSTKINTGSKNFVYDATLTVEDYIPSGTAVEYFMTADGGVHWEAVTPGVAHTFTNPGEDLRWRAVITGPKDRSVHIYQIAIEYNYNLAPTIPTITDLGDSKFTGMFKVKWNESTDDVALDHYELQMSETNSFSTITKNWTTTKNSKSMFGLSKGTYYFRARAVDNEGLASDWSTAESVSVKMSTLILGLIIGGVLVLIIAVIVVGLIFIKRKKTRTR